MSAVENVADVLDAAADRLAKPGAWTQGASARDARGHEIEPDNRKAQCWCMEGAIDAANAFGGLPFKVARRAAGVAFLHEWNDTPERTQDEVVAKLREAAALARQEQAA